jgi:hypothetical protein
MTGRTRTIAYAIITFGVVVTMWVLIHGLTTRVQDAEHSAQTNRHRVEAAKRDVRSLAAQVKGLGGQPVVKPGQVPGPTGATGPQGPGPSREQVLAAVETYCAGGACVGRGPSPAQVETAVAHYCSGGVCRGERGGVGPMGAPGVQGPQGMDGQNATDAQVMAAVDAYCAAHGNCQGSKGETGAPGKDAYPFTFTFTVPAWNPVTPDRTYTCTISDPSQVATCTEN